MSHNLDNHLVRLGCSAWACFPGPKWGICCGCLYQHTWPTLSLAHLHNSNMSTQGATHHSYTDSLDVAPLFSVKPEHPSVVILPGVERTVKNKHWSKCALQTWINCNMERAKKEEILWEKNFKFKNKWSLLTFCRFSIFVRQKIYLENKHFLCSKVLPLEFVDEEERG